MQGGNDHMDYTADATVKFADDKFATKTTGARIEEARVGYAKCSLEITSDHLNANGSVMGGAIFTLADLAFAASSNVGGLSYVAVTSNIEYMRAAKGSGTLYAESKCRKAGRSFGFYEITVTDETGREVALVSTTGYQRGAGQS